MATNLKSLSGVAVRGVKAHAGPSETFVAATMTDEKLVITYESRLRVQVSPRKFRTQRCHRMVTCEPSWHDGDFVWLPTKERTF